MTIECQTFDEAGLTVCTHIGKVSDKEFIKFYQNLPSRCSFGASGKVLVDVRKSDAAQRTPDTLRRMGSIIEIDSKRHPQRMKSAVLAPGDLAYGFARMTKGNISDSSWEFSVFRELHEALEWLEVPQNILAGQDGEAEPEV